MENLVPRSPGELAEALAQAASRRQPIQLGGAFSKPRLGGPIAPAATAISTSALTQVLQYEPHDLTISVQAGLPFRDLEILLAGNRQMVPLDPPFPSSTVGGVIAANLSGPRRHLYGTARDMVIGMQFATLEGKIVQSGGMVVKNVAGLDMAKLLIGSYGTLAAIAVVNFKLIPLPAFTRTYLLEHAALEEALAARDRIRTGVLQPAALDLFNPAAAARLDRSGWLLALQAGGNRGVIARYDQAFPSAPALEGDAETAFWQGVRQFVPGFLEQYPGGGVVRVSVTRQSLEETLRNAACPVLSRAGLCYCCLPDTPSLRAWLDEGAARQIKAVLEYGPRDRDATLVGWPAPGSDFAIMEKIKGMFDPDRLLNRGRFYGRI